MLKVLNKESTQKTPEEVKASDRAEKEQKIKMKLDEVQFFFQEIKKTQNERGKLINKKQGSSPKVRELDQIITEGVTDLGKEIDLVRALYLELGKDLVELEAIQRKFNELSFQENSESHGAGANLIQRSYQDGHSELQDMSLL